MAETKRTSYIGKVVSAKNDKTITVLVETYKKHPLYGKRVKYSKKYTAHDEKNIAKEGDTVRIISTRPLSKTKRTSLIGKVVSAKNDKTITVLVETYKKHPLYGKRVKYSKKYTAHDELNKAKEGDTVKITSTRPLSKTKRYELTEVLVDAVIL